MRIRLLIATADIDYGEHLSNFLSEKYRDTFEISLCTLENCSDTMQNSYKYDVALLDPLLLDEVDLNAIHLPLLLWSDSDEHTEKMDNLVKIRKYQRISSLTGDVLESLSKVSKIGSIADFGKAAITAVWSPSGGVGKTAVAVAYAAQKAQAGKDVLYLNLESFSSTPVYFPAVGKSISAIFDMLENHDGNIRVLARGMCLKDNASGIYYFHSPDNYDDINILSVDDTATLIAACRGMADELVIDMSCICNMRAWQIFEQSGKVLLVTDKTNTAQAKLQQFMSQHNIFEKIKSKTIIVANKNATISEQLAASSVSLPFVNSDDEIAVYKELSVHNFDLPSEKGDGSVQLDDRYEPQ
jgi:MinD-like ATPase involved in chromosome partitioning or flagellar assembly